MLVIIRSMPPFSYTLPNIIFHSNVSQFVHVTESNCGTNEVQQSPLDLVGLTGTIDMIQRWCITASGAKGTSIADSHASTSNEYAILNSMSHSFTIIGNLMIRK